MTTPTSGSWNAQFYGPSTTGAGDETKTIAPSSVAGQFSAHTVGGAIEVHGTFAARQMMSDDDM